MCCGRQERSKFARPSADRASAADGLHSARLCPSATSELICSFHGSARRLSASVQRLRGASKCSKQRVRLSNRPEKAGSKRTIRARPNSASNQSIDQAMSDVACSSREARHKHPALRLLKQQLSGRRALQRVAHARRIYTFCHAACTLQARRVFVKLHSQCSVYGCARTNLGGRAELV